MASRNRIFNIDHNCFYDRGVIALGINNCAITWVKEGVSVRCLTAEEKREAEFKQAAAIEAIEYTLPDAEVDGLKFESPKTTKYRSPRAAYDDWEEPTVNRVCRWPRAGFMREWPSRSHVDQVIAQMETLS